MTPYLILVVWNTLLELLKEEIFSASGNKSSETVQNSEESRLCIKSDLRIVIYAKLEQTSKDFYVT